MLRDRLRAIIAAELDIAVEAIPADASAETFEPWDSLGHVRIIVAVEDQLGVRFTTAEIPELSSLDKLTAALAQKGVT